MKINSYWMALLLCVGGLTKAEYAQKHTLPEKHSGRAQSEPEVSIPIGFNVSAPSELPPYILRSFSIQGDDVHGNYCLESKHSFIKAKVQTPLDTPTRPDAPEYLLRLDSSRFNFAKVKGLSIGELSRTKQISPDGKHLILEGSEKELRLVDATTGEDKTKLLSKNLIEKERLQFGGAFSDNGRFLAVEKVANPNETHKGTLILDFQNEKVKSLPTVNFDRLYWVSNHGKYFTAKQYSNESQGEYKLFSSENGAVLFPQSDQKQLSLYYGRDISMSQDGKRIAFTVRDRVKNTRSTHIYQMPEFKLINAIKGYPINETGTSSKLSPDGKYFIIQTLAKGDESYENRRRTKLIEVASGQEIAEPPFLSGYNVDICPNGQMLATKLDPASNTTFVQVIHPQKLLLQQASQGGDIRTWSEALLSEKASTVWDALVHLKEIKAKPSQVKTLLTEKIKDLDTHLPPYEIKTLIENLGSPDFRLRDKASKVLKSEIVKLDSNDYQPIGSQLEKALLTTNVEGTARIRELQDLGKRLGVLTQKDLLFSRLEYLD